MKTRTYLDYNASAPLIVEATTLMNKIMQAPYNASSIHSFGREGRKYIEDARTQIGALINTDPEQIIFNSGATEGNNTILKHFRAHYPDEQIIISAIEHPSIIESIENPTIIPVTPDGVIDLGALESALTNGKKTALVSIMTINNETGAIQPIKAAADLAHKHGALFHSDATQAAGRIALNMQELGIDFLTLSSHKIGGPQGVGALAMRLCGETPTLLQGGGQEKSARAGTENVAGIAGFGVAAEHALKNIEIYQALKTYRDDLETSIKSIAPECIFYAQNTRRAANTIMFSIPGLSSETLMMSLDLENIAVSNGSACSSGSVEPSYVLKAMGASDEEASSALRISMGWYTTDEDIIAFLCAWKKIYARLQKNAAPLKKSNA